MQIFPADGISGRKTTLAEKQMKRLLQKIGLQLQRKKSCHPDFHQDCKSTELCTLYFIFQQCGRNLHIILYTMCMSDFLITHHGKTDCKKH